MSHRKRPGRPHRLPKENVLAPVQSFNTPADQSENIFRVDHGFLSSNYGVWPATKNLASKIQFNPCLYSHPFRKDRDDPLMQSGLGGTLQRCAHCKTYLNPFCSHDSNFYSWRCNICNNSNQTNEAFRQNLCNSNGEFVRHEVTDGAVDIIVDQSFGKTDSHNMGIYVFAICTTNSALQTGTSSLVIESLIDWITNMDELESAVRKIAILTYDTKIEFHTLNFHENSTTNSYVREIYVMSDSSDPFVPIEPNQLLINITEHKEQVLEYLRDLATDIAERAMPVSNANCFGSVVQIFTGYFKDNCAILCVFNHGLANYGVGSVLEQKKDKTFTEELFEETFVNPPGTKTQFYRKLSISGVEQALGYAIFQFSTHNSELTTIGSLCENGGTFKFYPVRHDAYSLQEKFEHELYDFLNETHHTKVYMRLRANKGLFVRKVYGYLGVAAGQTNLVKLTYAGSKFNCSYDIRYIGEQFDKNIYFQLAILRESRKSLDEHNVPNSSQILRLFTIQIPTSYDIDVIFNSADMATYFTYITRKALVLSVEAVSMANTLEYIQDSFTSPVFEWATRSGMVGDQLVFITSLNTIPHAILGFLKSEAFSDKFANSNLDQSYLQKQHLNVAPKEEIQLYCIPNLFSIAEILDDEAICTYDEDNHFLYPERFPLTQTHLHSNELFFFNNGLVLIIWVGASVELDILEYFFHPQEEDPFKLQLQDVQENDYDSPLARLHNLIYVVRENNSVMQPLTIVNQGSKEEDSYFLKYLYNDPKEATMSLDEFHRFIGGEILLKRNET